MDIVLAIQKARPNSQFTVGQTYDSLVWLDSSSKPTEAEVNAAWNLIKDDVAWNPVRAKRNDLLAKSDWTQLSDSSANKVAWANYRQKLRDIPQDFDKPEDVIWPTKPE